MTTAAEWHSKGLALLETGDLHEARNHFALALNDAPQNAPYMLDYAQAYVDLGQYEKAETFFRAALDLDPASATGNYRFANLLKQFGHLHEAIAKYSLAIAAKPEYVEAFNNRGAAYHTMGETNNAAADYRRAIGLDPHLSQAYLNLGRLLDSSGDFEAASELYRGALKNGLDQGLFTHLLQSVSGAPSDKAPVGYVRAIFDDYAGAFDHHLTQTLGYTLPSLIGAQVRALYGASANQLIAVDLGCGTGLCGVEIASCVGHLAGVDASPRMLDHADRRGIYHDLIEGDIERYLPALDAVSVDLLIAADVFIYIGALEKIFSEAGRILRTGGVFIFSIEHLAENAGHQLQRTGRFQHSIDYIEQLGVASGFAVERVAPVELRLEQARPVPGGLFTLRRVFQSASDTVSGVM